MLSWSGKRASLVELSSVGNTTVEAGQNGKDKSYFGQFGGLAVDMSDSLKTSLILDTCQDLKFMQEEM